MLVATQIELIHLHTKLRKISTSVTYLSQIARVRKAQAVESIRNDLDTAVTAPLSAEGMDKLLWILTRVPPCHKLSQLNVSRSLDIGVVYCKLSHGH